MVCHHNTHQSSTLLFSKALKIRQKAASSRDYHINHHHTGAQGLDFPSISIYHNKERGCYSKAGEGLEFQCPIEFKSTKIAAKQL